MKQIISNVRYIVIVATILNIVVPSLFGAQKASQNSVVQSLRVRIQEKEKFFAAAKSGNYKLLEKLADSGKIQDPANCQEQGTGKTALMCLAEVNHFEDFTDWIGKYCKTINLAITDANGNDIRKIVANLDHEYLAALDIMLAYDKMCQKEADESKKNLEKELDCKEQEQKNNKPQIKKNIPTKSKNNKKSAQRIQPQQLSAANVSKVSRLTTLPAIAETAVVRYETPEQIWNRQKATAIAVSPMAQAQRVKEAAAQTKQMYHLFFTAASAADIHRMQYAQQHGRIDVNSIDEHGNNALTYVLQAGIQEAATNNWAHVNNRYEALGWLLGHGALNEQASVLYMAQRYAELVRNTNIISIFLPYIKNSNEAHKLREAIKDIEQKKLAIKEKQRREAQLKRDAKSLVPNNQMYKIKNKNDQIIGGIL